MHGERCIVPVLVAQRIWGYIVNWISDVCDKENFFIRLWMPLKLVAFNGIPSDTIVEMVGIQYMDYLR